MGGDEYQEHQGAMADWVSQFGFYWGLVAGFLVLVCFILALLNLVFDPRTIIRTILLILLTLLVPAPAF